MSTEIVRIHSTDDVFKSQDFLNNKLSFNYIDGARKSDETELFSDKKRVIICRKKDNKSVWIWTDDDVCDDIDTVIAIANKVREFDVPNLEFYTKPNLAKVFSDMYALVSSDLDYQIKNEFSLGAFKFIGKDINENTDVTVLKYNKKYSEAFYNFYDSLKNEFNWSNEKLKETVAKFSTFNSYLLLKNSEIISVCVIRNDSDDYSSIRSVATKKEYRNQGFATIVTNTACKQETKHGKQIMLYANKGNQSAVSTFKKAGFELKGEVHLIKS